MTGHLRRVLAAYAAKHPFSFFLAVAAVLGSLWLVLDPAAFTNISIAQATNHVVGIIWLCVCAAGGITTLAGVAWGLIRLEACGLVLLSAALGAQALGTTLNFGGKSAFPIMVFAACAVALLVQVGQLQLRDV